MANSDFILPANVPITSGGKGLMDANWWRYFNGQNRATTAAFAGEVSTPPGSGLEGGGQVGDGVALSIAPNGVTDAMLRNSISTSVIGRFQGSDGDPADIQATADNRVLSREDGELAFRSTLALMGIDTLILGTNPPATAASTGTAGTITWDTSFLYVCTATDTWKRVAIATW